MKVRIIMSAFWLIVCLVQTFALYHFVILNPEPKDQTSHIIIALWLCTGFPMLAILSVYLFRRLSRKQPRPSVAS